MNSPYRETPKSVLKKKQEKNRLVAGGGWVGLGFSKCTGGVRRFFSVAPR
jgi:hypothetical protein